MSPRGEIAVPIELSHQQITRLSRMPWENGYVESFNARLRDELLNGEIFYTLLRPRSSSRAGAATTMRSGHMPRLAITLPPQVFVPALAAWPAAQLKANACIRPVQSAAPATLLLPTSPNLN